MFKYVALLCVVVALAQAGPFPQEPPTPPGANSTPDQPTEGQQGGSSGASPSSDNKPPQTNTGASSQATPASLQTTPAPSQATPAPSQATPAPSQAAPGACSSCSQNSSQAEKKPEYQKATLGEVIDRLGDAARLTVIEEKESIHKALKSIQAATGHTIKAGLDTLGSGLNMILIVPKFAFNAIGIKTPDATSTTTQASVSSTAKN